MSRPRAKMPKFSLNKRGEIYYVQWWEDNRAHRASLKTGDHERATRSLAEFVARRGHPPSLAASGSLGVTAENIVAMSMPFPPMGSGLYFLIRAKKVVYVGRSVNVQHRIGWHAREKRFDAWAFLPCEAALLAKLERHYINALQPELNCDPHTLSNAGKMWSSLKGADNASFRKAFSRPLAEETNSQAH